MQHAGEGLSTPHGAGKTIFPVTYTMIELLKLEDASFECRALSLYFGF